MGAATRNITVEQGIDFTWHGLIQNAVDNSAFDLTGYTAEAQVREEPDSAKSLATMTCSTGDDPTLGDLTISMTPEETDAIPTGVYHWDLVIRSPDAPDIKLLKGRAVVEATASR